MVRRSSGRLNPDFDTFECMKEIIIEGSRIHDIAGFYQEINRIFMKDEDWQLGQTLDGFNDLLYGGFGLLKSEEPVTLIWKDFALSKAALGFEVTRQYYLSKIAPDSPFDKPYFRRQLADLEAGHGKTYFDIIMEIIAEHPNIRLIEK